MARRLTEIANDYGTDKGTTHGDRHGYTLIYELLLAPYRDLKLNLLEIGLQTRPETDYTACASVTNAPSVKMWREYYPKAHIYGIDISDFSAYQSDRFTFFQVDCGSAEQLDRVAKSGATFDIIIDDGSHASYHQQLTLCRLFKSLKPEGVYIIEDLHWRPVYERELPKVPRTVDVLGNFLSNGKFADTGSISSSEWEPLEKQIGSILFVDDDTLVDLRRSFNIQHGIELPRRNGMWRRSHLRHIKRQLQQGLRVVRGDVRPPRQALTKLAIIHKAAGSRSGCDQSN